MINTELHDERTAYDIANIYLGASSMKDQDETLEVGTFTLLISIPQHKFLEIKPFFR